MRLGWASASLLLFACGAGNDGSRAREDGGTADHVVDATRDALHDADARGVASDAGLDVFHDAAADVTGDATGDARTLVDATPDVAPFVDAPYPAFALGAPQVVNQGGPVLANPRFVPVVFPGETLASSIDAFMAAVGGSQYWTAIGAEYGVGAATSAALVTESTSPGANLTDAEIQSFLADALATDPRFLGAASDAAPSPNIAYVLFYPAGTTITAASLGTGCVDFGGYHSSFVLPSGVSVPYAVVPRCATLNGVSGLDEVTAIASHELIELATDPNENDRAFVGTDLDHIVWTLTTGDGEVADLCSLGPGAYLHPAEAALSGFVVQRVWSNQAALAGRDPCKPLPASDPTYFHTVPETTSVPFTAEGQTYQTLGTKVPVGQTATVFLDLASNGVTDGPWSVSVVDYGAAYGGPTVLDLKLVGPVAGTNGDRLELQVTPLSAASASLYGLSPYFVYSTRGTVVTTWIGAVSN